MPSKKQSIDMLIYLEGLPTEFETVEKKDGAFKPNVKIIEMT